MSLTTRIALLTGSAAATVLLTGCGLGSNSSLQVPTTVQGASIHGSVFGGQQPIVGATIKLYATGTTGYGSAYPYTTGDNLLGNLAITTGAGGSFNVTGDYTCPAASTPVYVVATGGNSGYTTNANIALMAGLGPCGSLAAATFVNINEITTVASVYTLAPFITGTANVYTEIGTTSTNITGLTNAMADVNVLANVSNGTPAASLASPYTSTVVTGATMPVPALDTLADIIAACINSAGGAAGSSTNCGTLFTATTVGSTAPTDTITALFNITQHPASNVASLYGLASATSPFQPTLPTQPNDFTLAATFPGVSSPSALAADNSGNIWVANSTANTVSELAHTGAVLSGFGYTASLSTPSAIAIDANDVVWVTNQGNNTVSRLNGTSGAAIGSPSSGGGLNLPRSIAFDSLGNAWVANSGNASVTVINNAATTLTNYTPAATTNPLAIAVNPH